MTVLYGLDSSGPPTPAQARAWFDAGYRFYCLYVDGNTPHKWTTDEIRRVTDVGFQVIPITVAPLTSNLTYDQGVAAGNSMLVAMQARGLSGVGCLDVEDGFTPVEYVQGFGDAMHAGNAATLLYGSSVTLQACAGPAVDYYWLCHWITGFVGGIPECQPDWDVWQYTDGSPCDFNAARSDFPFAGFNG